jgi:hypothetical protein
MAAADDSSDSKPFWPTRLSPFTVSSSSSALYFERASLPATLCTLR